SNRRSASKRRIVYRRRTMLPSWRTTPRARSCPGKYSNASSDGPVSWMRRICGVTSSTEATTSGNVLGSGISPSCTRKCNGQVCSTRLDEPVRAMLKRKPRARRGRTPGLRPYLRWLLRSRLPRLAFLTALGTGLISGFADNDAGGITTYSVVVAQFGYDLMWVVLVSMRALAITQEVGARLGLATGQGFG